MAKTPTEESPQRRRRLPAALHHALRFVSHVLILSGILLIGDAVATVTWQEPLSAYQAGRQQNGLEVALADPPKRVLDKKPLRGDAIGQIGMPRLDETHYVVEGTDSGSLRKGPGHYPDTPLPSEKKKTVAIAGHRTTHGAPFRHVDRLRRGDRIILSMPYGRFIYKVTKTSIVPPTQVSVTKDVGYPQLVLSACHPLYSAAQRIIVFARLTDRQPPVVKGGDKVS